MLGWLAAGWLGRWVAVIRRLQAADSLLLRVVCCVWCAAFRVKVRNGWFSSTL